jgi:hypothetical protein
MAAPTEIIQFKAKLDSFKPVIWRTFEVASNITVATFSYTVMALFEMQASHLFCTHAKFKGFGDSDEYFFEFDYYGDIVNSDDMEYLDPRDYELNKLPISDRLYFRLNYDFGDNWNVIIKPKKIYQDASVKKTQLPRVLKGKGYGIVEDCGGVWGLEELVESFEKKEGERYESIREWTGMDDFDITKFDLDEMNAKLNTTALSLSTGYETMFWP